MMSKLFKRMGSALVAALFILVALPAPAHASSGGGCGPRVSWHFSQSTVLYVTSCISYQNPHLKPDFYVEGSAASGSNCLVVQQMTINGDAVSGGRHVATCVAGHYGPWNYAVNPPSGSAQARISIQINGSEAVVSYSPYVYFP
jgi:hypothetical protein